MLTKIRHWLEQDWVRFERYLLFKTSAFTCLMITATITVCTKNTFMSKLTVIWLLCVIATEIIYPEILVMKQKIHYLYCRRRIFDLADRESSINKTPFMRRELELDLEKHKHHYKYQELIVFYHDMTKILPVKI